MADYKIVLHVRTKPRMDGILSMTKLSKEECLDKMFRNDLGQFMDVLGSKVTEKPQRKSRPKAAL